MSAATRPSQGCTECGHRESDVGIKERDLGRLARRAARSDSPPAWLRREIETARTQLDEAKRNRAEHDATDHGGQS